MYLWHKKQLYHKEQKKRENKKHTSKEATTECSKLKENHKEEQIGKEGAQSNDWEKIGKSEGAKRERKFKN